LVADWLPRFVPLCINHGELTAVKIHLQGAVDSMAQEVILGQFPINEPRFLDRFSNKCVSLMEIWREIINSPGTFDEIKEYGVTYKVCMTTSSELNSRYLVRIEGAELEIDRMELEANLKVEPSSMPLVRAAQYLSQPAELGNEQVFVKLGHWKG